MILIIKIDDAHGPAFAYFGAPDPPNVDFTSPEKKLSVVHADSLNVNQIKTLGIYESV